MAEIEDSEAKNIPWPSRKSNFQEGLYAPAHKLRNWLDLNRHINTQRQPFTADIRAVTQFALWMNHGAEYGMDKVRWHEIDWPGQTVSDKAEPGYFVKCDPYTGALAIALNKASYLRIYLLLRHEIIRQNKGEGWINRKQARDLIQSSGYEITDRHWRRLLHEGDSIFWGWDKQSGLIHLRKPEKLAQSLIRYARDKGQAIGQLPGNRKPVYVDVSGSHEAFEAQLYAAVVTAHGGDWFASRALQQNYFNRSADTLRRWENKRLLGVVKVTPCYAEADKNYRGPVPQHAFKKNGRVRWQMVNHYASSLRQHNHKGRARAIRHCAEIEDLNTQPDGYLAFGGHRVFRKVYFRNVKTYQRVTKQHGEGTGRYLLSRPGKHNFIFRPMCVVLAAG